MRSSGILVHISSLPSAYGIGDLGPQAHAMVDFLASSGQRYWQVLPINPTDGINGHSPYSCYSAFAGNPLLISPQLMVIEGLLAPSDLKKIPNFDKRQVDFAQVSAFKQKILAKAYVRFAISKTKDNFNRFCKEQAWWLDDYATFIVAKEIYKGAGWNEWPSVLRRRQSKAIVDLNRSHGRKIGQVKFTQFVFFGQWKRLKAYANSQGVGIIGDIPIYVNYDSVEVWCNPDFFKLDSAGHLKFVSGCPPDYFSKTGQRWGNPVYDWAALKKDKYRWWKGRIAHNLKLFDLLRIDHFRGFVSFWQIPAHEKLAVFGRWVKGPGKDFFKRLLSEFQHLPIIAEDLGEITPDVIAVMRQFKFPGMRVLLFGFGGDIKTNPHVPANYPVNCVAYTGTHDNNTILGWWRSEAKPNEIANVGKVLKIKKVRPGNVHWEMISAVMASKARMAIIPLSDVLGLGDEARMNTPATKVHNWKWRFSDRMLSKDIAIKLLKITKASQRT